jgi:hypothetical protein
MFILLKNADVGRTMALMIGGRKTLDRGGRKYMEMVDLLALGGYPFRYLPSIEDTTPKPTMAIGPWFCCKAVAAFPFTVTRYVPQQIPPTIAIAPRIRRSGLPGSFCGARGGRNAPRSS